MWYVYLIKSSKKKWFYVGSTNSLDRRLAEHNSGNVRSTKPYRPFSIIFSKEFVSMSEARHYEQLLKNKRIEKEKIIKQYWDVV